MASDNTGIHPAPVAELIRHLKSFKEIGPKLAERLAYEIVRAGKDRIDGFVEAVEAVRKNIRFCSFCRGYSSGELCHICSDCARDDSKICVVESPDDILAFERAGAYKGLYYSLSDTVSVSRGKMLDQAVLVFLVEKIKGKSIKEIIIATSMDIEGDLMSHMVAHAFKETGGIKITRLAFGLPVGADVKLADSATLIKSLEGRNEI